MADKHGLLVLLTGVRGIRPAICEALLHSMALWR